MQGCDTYQYGIAMVISLVDFVLQTGYCFASSSYSKNGKEADDLTRDSDCEWKDGVEMEKIRLCVP